MSQDDTTNISAVAPLGARGGCQLTALTGPDVGQCWVLGATAVVGRSRSCDLHLSDPDVSRQHIRLQRGEDGWTLEDLDSRNGTLLNSGPIQTAGVRYGDRIQIGSTVLQLTRVDQLEEDLQQSQRMESLGRLAGGIAHDFNNLIVVVLGNINYLQEQLADPSIEVQECLDDSEAALGRMGELTHQLLGFARRGKYEERWLDLSALVDEVARLCRRTFDKGIQIEVEGPPGLGVIGDPSQLMQVLVNICLNARDAVHRSGTITLRTEMAFADQLTTASFSPDADSCVVLSITDDGAGMEPSVVARVFEPFFTTKMEGTGLGLAMCYGIVASHGGHIRVRSELGSGTTFDILLPSSPRPERQGPPSSHSLPTTPQATILLIEDEALLRRTTTRLLQSFGYQVITACEGREGLERWRQARDQIDLVMLDLIMPVMDGEQTYRALQAEGNTTPVLLTTGHTDERRARALTDAGALLLRKPHDASTLQRIIASALSQEDAH